MQQHRSFHEFTFGGAGGAAALAEATQFIAANDAYVRQSLLRRGHASLAALAPWERQLALLWEQLDGLVAGLAAAAAAAGVAPSERLGRTELLLLNAVVDLSSLIHKPFAASDWTPARAAEYTRRSTHCSALVKVTADLSELFTAHNTWTSYFMMLRVSKSYDLPFDGVPARRMLMSGYFGTLASTDDFFVLSSGRCIERLGRRRVGGVGGQGGGGVALGGTLGRRAEGGGRRGLRFARAHARTMHGAAPRARAVQAWSCRRRPTRCTTRP